MTRVLLKNENIHSSILHKIGGGYSNIVDDVISAVNKHDVLVIGMRQNPVCKSAKKNLEKASLSYEYIEYGSYLSEWKPRLAIKMWSGWPTFPMVFVKGTLIGGNHELDKLIESGEIKALIAA